MDQIKLVSAMEPAKTMYSGSTRGTAGAGRRLQVRLYSAGPEEVLLDYEVPADQTATVEVGVSIVETEAT